MSSNDDQTTTTTTATSETTTKRPARPDEYNGWANYETWCVMLWIDNDRQSYNDAHEIVANAYARAAHQLRRNPEAITYPRVRAADALKEWVESENPLGDGASMFTDLLGNALARVDWMELADHIHAEE